MKTRASKICPVTIRGMVSALAKKYPDRYITIDTKCQKRIGGIKIVYSLYMAYIENIDNLSWNELRQEVMKRLK